MNKVLILRGSSEANSQLEGLVGEVTLDLNTPTLRVHDGSTTGGHLVAESIPTKLSQLTDSENLWTSESLTKVSQLDNGGEFWTTGTLTKVSQLQNDPGYKNGYCQYCWHCTYCQNCGRCYDVRCSQVHCYVKDCQQCSDCTTCSGNKGWDSAGIFDCGIRNCTKCVYIDC